jgi:methylated-DNA-[protein]-cysteine S-methyltransferase
MIFYATMASPIGSLLLVGDGRALHGLHMQDGPRPVAVSSSWEASEPPFVEVKAQLASYFSGERTAFDVPLDLVGTPFQRLVWRALRDIPYGATISYVELARRVGQPTASRAVGLANGRNPVSVIVPCHRVIGANGSLTGYGGGLARKRYLLDLESRQPSLLPSLT